MNNITPGSKRRLCRALFLIAAGTPASARTPRARVQQGNIQTIDRDARVLRIQCDEKPVPLTLVWNNRTSIFKENRAITASEQTNGTPVTVWYPTPFFGERFATKIVIQGGWKTPPRQQPHQSTIAKP